MKTRITPYGIVEIRRVTELEAYALRQWGDKNFADNKLDDVDILIVGDVKVDYTAGSGEIGYQLPGGKVQLCERGIDED